MAAKIRRALQARSQNTMDRIVEAAEQLLRESASPELPVREICRLAGASPSSFYSRFPEKSALLPLVVQRLAERGFAAIERARELHTPDLPLDVVIPQALDLLAETWLAEAGLVRAILAA